MKCLDTYALIEIRNGNERFLKYLEEDFVLADLTLAEFYWVLLRDADEETAEIWLGKLQPYVISTSLDTMAKAMKFRRLHKKNNFSFFDCVGYYVALQERIPFVTGDRQFREFPQVEFVSVKG